MKAGKKQSLSPNEKFSLLKLLSKNTKNLLKKKKLVSVDKQRIDF